MPEPALTAESIIRFPQRLRLRVPQGLPEAVEAAARQRHTSPSEWARQAILRGLEAEGLELIDGRIKVSR
jgi:hypothetical protein